MNKLTQLLKEKRLILDGGFGTMLQQAGLPDGQPPEGWNLTHPEKIREIHAAYVAAGCDIITANTFGINPFKYDNCRELITAAVDSARRAARGTDVMVAFDMGPTGRILKPFGTLDFEDAVSAYAELAVIAAETGVDLVIIETMNDCLETKAALLAVKENTDLPVIVTNVYDASGKLMTGADPEAMVAMLEGMGADAVGLNCSLGPEAMLPIVERLVGCASVPVAVAPNAGLPSVRDGRTVYDVDADQFASLMAKMAETGAALLGGCCGTTPEYIAKTVELTKNIPYVPATEKDITVVSSYTHAVRIGEIPVLIGERINPTGKPKLKEAIRTGDTGYILKEGIRQAEAGVQILDLNVGVPGTDEPENMLKLLTELQAVIDLPLQIDTSDPKALEAGMRAYMGKPLVNSVNGTKKSMDAVFPLVKKYGGAVIALAIGEDGIPETAAERAAIIDQIVAEAAKYGIKKKDIIADPLALTVSADVNAARVTLESIRLIKAAGIRTSLGVSNVSFGLPGRNTVNSVFFGQALYAGLDCAIMNPFSTAMMTAWYTHKMLAGLDPACGGYIGYISSLPETAEVTAKSPAPSAASDGGEAESGLSELVFRGLRAESVAEAKRLLDGGREPLSLINDEIIPALNKIGDRFEKKQAYLPQLLMSAEAATAAIAEVKERLPLRNSDSERSVILATVKGDVHDIGKNIVKVLLESYGFAVRDLGRDVAPEEVLKAAKESGCRLIGLSALMTTTVPAMAETIKLLRSSGDYTVMVGGAVLTKGFADEINADFYSPDAMGAVRFATEWYSER